MLSKAVHDARTVVSEEHRKGSRLVKRRTFVLEKTFHEVYGDPQNFNGKSLERDSHFVNAKLGTQFGYWLPGGANGHLPGHFEYEDYEDVSTTMRKEHERGDVQLAKEQATNKFDALSKLQSADRVRSEAKMAIFSAADLIAMARASSSHISGSLSDDTAGADSMDRKHCNDRVSGHESEHEDFSDDSDEDGRVATLALSRARKDQATPKASTPSVKSSGSSVMGASASKPKATAKSGGGGAPRAPPPPVGSGTGQKSSHVVITSQDMW